MKRYLLFYFDMYYPSGGANDFHGDFDTVDDAKNAAMTASWDFVQILDTKTKNIVFKTQRSV